ncbi:MAG TPA: hypothetical protein VNE39_02850 [Planctomycetota bacterium]|nr:hypothetical protein [Planctomycetota bacterium]
MGTLFLTLTFIIPVAVVLLLERGCYKAAGCLLATAGALWACLWSRDPGDAALMAPIGILGAILGALVYLHGVKRDILSYIDQQKQEILKAIEKATSNEAKEE